VGGSPALVHTSHPPFPIHGGEIGRDLLLLDLCSVSGKHEDGLNETIDICIWRGETQSRAVIRRQEGSKLDGMP
jgi:hypothetical protein